MNNKIKILIITMILVSSLSISTAKENEQNNFGIEFWDNFPKMGKYIPSGEPFLQIVPIVIDSNNGNMTIKIYAKNVGQVPCKMEAMVINAISYQPNENEIGWTQDSINPKKFSTAVFFDPFIIEKGDEKTIFINLKIDNNNYQLFLDYLISNSYDYRKITSDKIIIFNFL